MLSSVLKLVPPTDDIKVVPFQVRHYWELADRNKEDVIHGMERLEEDGKTHAFLYRDEVVLIGGLIEFWNGRAQGWAMLSKQHRHSFLKIHHAVKKYFEDYGSQYGRLEISVKCDFENGHRWAQLLGFYLETPRAVAYLPDGSDAAIYVRLK